MGFDSTSATPERPAPPPQIPRATRRLRAALLLGYLAVALAIYWPSLQGGPISDDYGFLLNPWVVDASPRHLLEILDPRSQATLSLRNYAPLRALANALEWKLVAENAPVYHGINVAMHALACWLAALLMIQSGLSEAVAFLGGAFLLAHPAQVEAVAWMSQIWNAMALALGAGALLAQRRRPLVAWALFALALLTRPTAVSFLPAALLREWSWRRAEAPSSSHRGLWLAAWALACLAVGSAELATFHESGAAARIVPYADVAAKARTLVADFGRYLAMAATGLGVSAFQEPNVALSWFDPWWLFGLGAGAAIAARSLVCLVRGREEAAWWAWGVGAFVPVSQLFPFLYPTADRYLYFMLPGLLGGALLAGREASSRLAAPARPLAVHLAAACALAAIGALALTSHTRAALWTSEDRVLADAARHYPRGVIANLLAARRAASQGDVDATVASIEACRARGWDYYTYLLAHPAFEPVRASPPFQALLGRFADELIEVETRRVRRSQLDWRDLAQAYELRRRDADAAAALERGLALGGPLDAVLRNELARLRTGRSDDAAIMAPGALPEDR